jgi:hypothetical protein
MDWTHLQIMTAGIVLGVASTMLYKYLVKLFSILEGHDEEKKQ